jgi:PAS domain S-box-containing protein
MKIKGLWANLPVSRKLYTVVGLMAVLIASELFTLLFAMNTLSSVRAFVAGEGQWSKAQKDAIHSLYQYALHGDESYYSEFNKLLGVTSGDHLARLELEKKDFNRDLVRQGLLQGKNHPADVDGMIELLVRFNKISYIRAAIEAWTIGDRLLVELRAMSEDLHRTIQTGGENSRQIELSLRQIARVNVELTAQENAFSAALGEGSRWMEGFLMTVLVLTVLTVESTGILLTYRFSRALGRRLKELMQTASEVGRGNFAALAPVVSRDELGQLAEAVNHMTSRLKNSLAEQLRIEAARRKGEETLRPLIDAVEDYAIFILDPKGRVVTWNLGAQRLKGYAAEEIIGKHFSIFFPARDIEDHIPEESLDHARTTGRFEAETVRVRKDGSEFYAHVVITPIRDSSGRITGFAKVTRDMTAQVQAEHKLRKLNEELEKRVEDRTRALKRREAQLKLITDAVPVLIAQLDTQERFLFANEAFCSWFRTTRAEIAGAPFKEIIGPSRYLFNQPHIKKVLNGTPTAFEQLSEMGDSKLNLAVTLVPVMDDEDEVSGFILVGSDVTQYKKIQDELVKARHSADVASATKSVFLTNMSHEIRTPLAAILGFAEIMTESTSPEQQANCARVIRSNGRILSNLINDILDLSKVEAGRFEIERLDVPIAEIINEVKSLLIPTAHAKGLTLTVGEDEAIPKVINTDPLRLRQILVNLVGNAIKFTERGSISIRIEARPGNGGEKLAFVIRDTGRGISPEQAKRLFTRDCRGGGSRKQWKRRG